MSYSYIKSVFPNFENSNKVYDETLYTNINSSLYNNDMSQVKPLENFNHENKRDETFILPPNKLLEKLENLEKLEKLENLTNVNDTSQIIPKQIIPLPVESKIEIWDDCDTHVKHILNCKQCKMLAIKQLSIESDKYRNEEMMELASYVIFGMFILLLIDSLKKNK